MKTYQVDLWQHLGKWHVGLSSEPEQYEREDVFEDFQEASLHAMALAAQHGGCYVCDINHETGHQWRSPLATAPSASVD